MKQRDNRWRQRRLGDVTGSRFADVLSRPSASGVFKIEGKRGEYYVAGYDGEILGGCFATKADAEERRRDFLAEWQKTHWSESAESYVDEKLAELIHCVPGDVWRSDATDWGTAQEPNAFEAAIPVIQSLFHQELSLPVNEYAYIAHPTEPHIGCSPDGIIGDDATAEIKCFYNGAKWMRMRRRGIFLPPEHKPQVQGQLWVTGRKWCAFCVFDPRVIAKGLDPLLMLRIERDDDYIDNVLAPRITAFRDYLYTEYDKLVERQVF